MRLFIAVNLPPEVREGLWAAAAPLRDRDYPVRWVAPEGLHLTVKFLGDVPPAREAEIVGGLEAAVSGTKPIVLPVGGFGAFPSPRHPRVVWAGCEGVPPLELLQHRVEREMEALGFPIEGRPFRPHVTLGRARRGARAAAFRPFPEALEALAYDTEVVVRSIELMESRLSRQGARYSERHRAEFPG